MTKIYCDGACKGNPGYSGSGIIIYKDNKIIRMAGAFEESGTNNTAELKALIHSLKIAERINEKCIIKTDSSYSRNSIIEWAYSWKKKGWKKKGGIKNLDLIKEAHTLYDLLKENVVIEHVKGHAGIEGNEEADKMANYAVENRIIKWRVIND